LSQQEWDGKSELPKRKLDPEAELYRIERDDARDLARKMFRLLQLEFPPALDKLIEDWPENPPRWLYER
jgi:hypothetical protein